MTALHGLRVWVTRPAHQAGGLCAAIEAAGGHALRQPLLAIAEPRDPAAACAGLDAAARAQAVIFTSVNAVIGAWQLRSGFAPVGTAAAIGQATARALTRRLGREPLLPAADYSSEGLLALPLFARPAGADVAIVTGEGGRGHLQAVLAERGARVIQAAVYRREHVPIARPRLAALLAEADAIVITSGEALEHLVAITPAAQRARLRSRQLVVPSERVLKRTADLRFSPTPLRPQGLQDAAVVAALARRHSVVRSSSRRGNRI